MPECSHCDRYIFHKPVRKTLSVDESVEGIPTGEAEILFCDHRCFRDWFEDLVGFQPVLEIQQDLAVSQSGGKGE